MTCPKPWRLVPAAALLLSACAGDIRIEAGSRFDPDLLNTALQAGVSTEAEVIAALGAPFGRGRAMYPFHDAPLDALSYYYEVGTVQDDRRAFLWVFVKDGVYDGHIWFSSIRNL